MKDRSQERKGKRSSTPGPDPSRKSCIQERDDQVRSDREKREIDFLVKRMGMIVYRLLGRLF